MKLFIWFFSLCFVLICAPQVSAQEEQEETKTIDIDRDFPKLKGKKSDVRVVDPKLQVISPKISGLLPLGVGRGTKVFLNFSVREIDHQKKKTDAKPVNNLKAGLGGNFRVFIEGVQETSFETLSDNSVSAETTGVTLVLDTSYSMQHENALSSMKQAADKFVSRLSRQNKNFEFQYYQFANRVQKIGSLSDIDKKKSSDRFTSMYSAIATAMRDHPGNIILLFSDGADNMSPSNPDYPIADVRDLAKMVAETKTVIYAIKLGLHESNDSRGVDSKDALEAITMFGNYDEVGDPQRLVESFEEIASRVARRYSYEYFFSEARPGTYKMNIQIDRNGVASNSAQWNPEAVFSLEFTIPDSLGRNVNSAPVAKGEDVEFSWERILQDRLFWLDPMDVTRNPGTEPQVSGWRLVAPMIDRNGVVVGMNPVPDHLVSPVSLSMRFVGFDPASNTVTVALVWEGPSSLMTWIQQNRIPLGISISEFRLGALGSSRTPRIVSHWIPGPVPSENGQQVSLSSSVLSVQLAPNVAGDARWIQVIGTMRDLDGSTKSFSVTKDSLIRLP